MINSEKNAGYLADTTYPNRFHRELSPVWLNYVATNAGVQSLDLQKPFTYLDLGCGFAHSTIVNAGAFPSAQFYACDFNSEHINAAKNHAKKLDINNIQFYEAYFEDLLNADLPQFDFIILHGIYSWVGPQVRETIQKIIVKKLKPTGVLYLSYNCLPGWSAESPLRKLMLELTSVEKGNINEKTQRALSSLQTLSASSLKFFKDNPSVNITVDSFAKDPSNYLAHEFLNEVWELYYSIDIADQMASCGLSFLGSATLVDNHPMLVMDNQSAASVSQQPTARLQQLMMDFATNQRFRRDVFVGKGRIDLSTAQRFYNLKETIVGCMTDVEKINTEAVIPRGKMGFQQDFIAELRTLMKNGPVSLGDAVTTLSGPGRDVMEITQNLVFLLAAGTLMPFAKKHCTNKEQLQRCYANHIIKNALENIVNTKTPGVVPSEVLGNGVMVQVEEALATTEWILGVKNTDEIPSRFISLGLII